MNAQFKKGALELCVLSQLALRDQYGYELTENISKEVKGWAYQEQLKKEWFDFTAAVERLIVSKESK